MKNIQEVQLIFELNQNLGGSSWSIAKIVSKTGKLASIRSPYFIIYQLLRVHVWALHPMSKQKIYLMHLLQSVRSICFFVKEQPLSAQKTENCWTLENEKIGKLTNYVCRIICIIDPFTAAPQKHFTVPLVKASTSLVLPFTFSCARNRGALLFLKVGWYAMQNQRTLICGSHTRPTFLMWASQLYSWKTNSVSTLPTDSSKALSRRIHLSPKLWKVITSRLWIIHKYNLHPFPVQANWIIHWCI